MSFQKFGTGKVTETEGPLSKTAKAEWTPQDDKELAEENEANDV